MVLLFNLRDEVEDIRALQDKTIFIEREVGSYFDYTSEEAQKEIFNQYNRISTLTGILGDYLFKVDELLESLSFRLTEEIEKAPESVGALK
ncbi:MAG: hypothetical protein RSA63_02695 [Eubacterium sp.]